MAASGTGTNPMCIVIGDVVGCSIKLRMYLPLNASQWDQHPEYEVEVRQQLAASLGAAIDDVSISLVQGVAAGAGTRRRLLQDAGLEVSIYVTLPSRYDMAEAEHLASTINSITVGGEVVSTSIVSQFSAIFSYDAPNVTAILPRAHPSDVSGDEFLLTIVGVNFGPEDTTPYAAIGGTACHRTVWTSDSLLSCVVPAGRGSKAVGVTVDGSATSSSIKYAFRPQPTIERLEPNNAPVLGGLNITLIGADFGHVDHTPSVTMGSTACESSQWVSDSLVVCKLPYGWGQGFDARVDISLEAQTLSNAFTYDARLGI